MYSNDDKYWLTLWIAIWIFLLIFIFSMIYMWELNRKFQIECIDKWWSFKFISNTQDGYSTLRCTK